MDQETGFLGKLFLYAPPIVLAAFLWNHPEVVTENRSLVSLLTFVGGGWAVYTFLPEVWQQVKGALPILVFLSLFVFGAMYVVFGGGADSVSSFSGKGREQIINNME